MAQTQNYTVTFVRQSCPTCSVLYLVTEEFIERKQELSSGLGYFDHSNQRATMYCPNGHESQFTGENATKKSLREAQAELTQARGLQRLAEQQREKAEADARRVKKRAANGVCPCCKRSFQNVVRHMHSKHPGVKC